MELSRIFSFILSSFIQHCVREIHPCCLIYQSLVPFFIATHLPLFEQVTIYLHILECGLFPAWGWKQGLFPAWGSHARSRCEHSYVYFGRLCTHFSWGSSQEWDPWVTLVCLPLVDTDKQFSKLWLDFYFHQPRMRVQLLHISPTLGIANPFYFFLLLLLEYS